MNTQFVADEVQKHLQPVIAQLQTTITHSFEILQSTMRGIYQQSQRAQQAVEDMSAHSRDLEMRMNEQRKADQNFYQDKIFSMVGAFCDRIERQIDIRMKALSTIELMNTKQNEALFELENMKMMVSAMQKNSDQNRGEISRIENNAAEANSKLIDVQIQTQSTEDLIRDTLQNVQNHRAEFKLIRAEIKSAVEYMGKIVTKIENTSFEAVNESISNPIPGVILSADDETDQESNDDNQIITDLIEQKHRELESLERNIEFQTQPNTKDDATLILSLLRAQKLELQRVAEEAKSYLKNQDFTPKMKSSIQSEATAQNLDKTHDKTL